VDGYFVIQLSRHDLFTTKSSLILKLFKCIEVDSIGNLILTIILPMHFKGKVNSVYCEKGKTNELIKASERNLYFNQRKICPKVPLISLIDSQT